jgi:hypothetical protein
MRQKIELNRALSITHLSELSSVYVPIYTPTEKALKTSNLQPYLQFNVNILYIYKKSFIRNQYRNILDIILALLLQQLSRQTPFLTD